MAVSKWGVVTAVGPVRVKVDGDTVAVPVTLPSTVLEASLQVDDMVLCDTSHSLPIIVGRSGGIPVPDAIPDASTTVKGIAELATPEETTTGTDSEKVATPEGVAAALDNRLPYKQISGKFATTGGSGGGGGASYGNHYWDGTTTITFPDGGFDEVPVVVASLAGGSGVVYSEITAVTATNFTIRVYRFGASVPSGYAGSYIAIQQEEV